MQLEAEVDGNNEMFPDIPEIGFGIRYEGTLVNYYTYIHFYQICL